jgi:hypothetical protein
VALVAAFGCKRERIQRLEKSAVEHEREAKQELSQAAERAKQEVAGGREQAHEEHMKAIEDEKKAESLRQEMRGEEIEPVGGKMPSLESALSDELGADWRVDKHGAAMTATRVKSKPRAAKFDAEVREEMKEFRGEHKEATALHQGDQVTLRGRIDDCGKAAHAADEFAEIDGINKIFVDISCAK